MEAQMEQPWLGLEEELAYWDVELSLKGPYAEFTKKRLDSARRQEEFPSSLFEVVLRSLWESFPGEEPYQVMELV